MTDHALRELKDQLHALSSWFESQGIKGPDAMIAAAQFSGMMCGFVSQDRDMLKHGIKALKDIIDEAAKTTWATKTLTGGKP